MKLTRFPILARLIPVFLACGVIAGCGDGRPPLPEGPSPDEAAKAMILQEVDSLREMVGGEGIDSIRDLGSIQEEQLSGISFDGVASETETKLNEALDKLKSIGADAATISKSELTERLQEIEQQVNSI